jgi:hypothetical protein
MLHHRQAAARPIGLKQKDLHIKMPLSHSPVLLSVPMAGPKHCTRFSVWWEEAALLLLQLSTPHTNKRGTKSVTNTPYIITLPLPPPQHR